MMADPLGSASSRIACCGGGKRQLSVDQEVSGSHGRAFIIRHKKSPEASPGGEIVMT